MASLRAADSRLAMDEPEGSALVDDEPTDRLDESRVPEIRALDSGNKVDLPLGGLRRAEGQGQGLVS